MTSDPFVDSLAAHRAELLRHCYRMLGSFHDAEETVQEVLASAWKSRASYTGAAPLRHWLFRIATNACLNARRASRVRTRPDLVSPASRGASPIGVSTDPEGWVTAAPDSALFDATTQRDAARLLEDRESVALAFVALLQGLPARQRAVLLLKDVIGFSVEEIASALDMSGAAVASALHRAREIMPKSARVEDREPPPEMLRAFIRCWESRDLEGLLLLLREDVTLTMPPWTLWMRGREEVSAFFRTEGFGKFWSSGVRLVPTRANGRAAVVFHRDGGQLRHSVMLLSFDGEKFFAMDTLLGPTFLRGF